jgi:hypothetical protein
MRRLVASLALALVLVLVPSISALAAGHVVSITVTAKLIKIENTMDTWEMGIIEVDDIVYFSATGDADPDYSQIENVGNVPVNIEIQGTDIDGTGDLDWVLASTADVEQYCLYANSEATPTVYDVEVASSGYSNLVENLLVDDTYDWSMKFTAPSAFDALEDGEEKTASVTLVASEYTPPP